MSRPEQEGHRLAIRMRRQIGEEILNGRLAGGVDQRAAARAAGMSHSQYGRIERGTLANLTFDQASRAGLAVGLRLGARMFPDGDPVRDAAHLRLLERFRAVLPMVARWQTEVPMAIPGDHRAWDAVVQLGGRRAGCEAETRLTDIQALERRLTLKLRDGEVDVLILVVADTKSNRAVLDGHREDLRSLLPLDGRHVLRALREGRLPDSGSLVVL